VIRPVAHCLACDCENDVQNLSFTVASGREPFDYGGCGLSLDSPSVASTLRGVKGLRQRLIMAFFERRTSTSV
jgi:hypothetical protein